MWEFFTEPEFQQKLDWTAAFVRAECEPLDLLFPRPGDPYDVHNKASRAILAPLREKVKDQGLWACHLGPELGAKSRRASEAMMENVESFWCTASSTASKISQVFQMPRNQTITIL